MAASEILTKYETVVKPACTIGNLANGAGRLSDAVDNSTVRAGAVQVGLKIKTGASAPTASTPVKLYLVRHIYDGATDLGDNGLGLTDAAVSTEPIQAEYLGCIIVTAATATVYVKTNFFAYDLSYKYNFVVWNAIGQALDGATFELWVQPITPEAQ